MTRRFLVLSAALVALAVLRSSWATRLDGLTIDEPFHLVAGASYVRHGDFRLNPEHPPLVKLWVGRAIPEDRLPLPDLRPLHDKPEERAFAESVVYASPDPVLVQGLARRAMLLLNALLLAAFVLSARAVLGETIALASLAFLVVDPTVAAHLPVVMTDLPVTLLSATAVLLASRAFQTGSPGATAFASLALGGALGAKHSGIVTFLTVVVLALPHLRTRLRNVLCVLVGAYALLWAQYGFRYRESPGDGDTFNRPLQTKIEDVASPATRAALRTLEQGHLLPRSYLWGLADVTRASLEGRGYAVFAFGRSSTRTPPWLFPGLLAVKVPLGLLALSLAGAGLALTGRSARGRLAPLGLLAALFLLFLARSGAGYAGVRHALPVFPTLAVLAGLAIEGALGTRATPLRVAALVAGAFALVSALPVQRPWEYVNALGGGTSEAYRLFGDEGIDIGQRTTELLALCRDELAPGGDVPFVEYPLPNELARRSGLRTRPWLNDVRDGKTTDEVSGVLLVAATRLAPAPWYDLGALRHVAPVERRGNLLVFRGTFRVPWLTARHELSRAMSLLYGASPDPAAARPLLRHAVELYPEGYVAALELGNVELLASNVAAAADAYETAQRHAPEGTVRERLAVQVRELRSGGRPKSVRNPWLE